MISPALGLSSGWVDSLTVRSLRVSSGAHKGLNVQRIGTCAAQSCNVAQDECDAHPDDVQLGQRQVQY